MQDYSYALPDPGAVITCRHHLRIWETSYTMDGMPIWVAAATHDVAIEIAKRGRLINHRLDPVVNAERKYSCWLTEDALVRSLPTKSRSANPVFQAET